ncbi:MAG: hypothetical protein KC502_19535 [Myxococcales bacterium]|nr:hypothetical protein [Myxococcales bacterium]
MHARKWLVAWASLTLTLGGCGLSDVGPESDKLAKWRASDGIDEADTSGDAGAGDTVQSQGDGMSGDTEACAALTCDDDNVCTSNHCESGKCVYKPVAGSCSDGDACTADDACKAGKCEGGAAKTCVDSNPCTVDSCNTETGNCGFTAKTTGGCDDGDACTLSACQLVGQGPDVACQVTGTVDCDDGNTCTNDSCEPNSGCANLPKKATCDDGDVCTVGGCAGASCTSGDPISCDDGNPCTDDSCKAKQGCVHANNQAKCDDGVPCTIADLCASGVCGGKAALFESSWSGPKFTVVSGVLPTANEGFIAVGADGTKNGHPVGKIWSFAPSDGLPLTWQVTLTDVRLDDVAQLPNGGTLVVGIQMNSDVPNAWAAAIDGSKTSVGLPTVDKSGAGMWMRAAAVTPTEFGVAGVYFSSGGEVIGRLARMDSQAKIIKTTEIPGCALWGVSPVGTPSKLADAVACGETSGGTSGAQAWFARASATGTVVSSRPFGRAGAHCRNLVPSGGGQFMAVGYRQPTDENSRRARWWRLAASGAVLASWTPKADVSSEFTDVVAGEAIFAIGNTHALVGSGQSKLQAGLLARVAGDGSHTWTHILPGAGNRRLSALAWHSAGYVVGAGAQQPASGKEALIPLVVTTDPWGNRSCAKAGACAKVSLLDCQGGHSCQLASCDAKTGCQKTSRDGACDDGKACTAGARCEAGSCVGGQPRFGMVSKFLAAGETPAGPWVAANAHGTATVAYVDGAAGARTLRVERRAVSGQVAWTSKTLLQGNLLGLTPRFVVAAGGATWIGGDQLDGKRRWLLHIDDKGQAGAPLIEAAAATSWIAGAPTPTGGVLLVGRTGGTSQVRRVAADGTTSWQHKLFFSPDAVSITGDGWLISGSQGAAHTPANTRVSWNGNVSGASPVADKIHGAYVGNWQTETLHAGDGVATMVAQWPGKPAPQLKKPASPRVMVLSPDGHPRTVAIPFASAPTRLLGSVRIAQSTLVVATYENGPSTDVTVAQLNAAGAVAETWTVTLKDTVQLAGAATVTTDGALLLATRGVDANTKAAKLRVQRMSVWGHPSCTEAGQCGDQSIVTCDTGFDCKAPTCGAKSGCGQGQAPGCLPADVCQGASTCAGKVCKKSATSTVCDDGNSCTTDSCTAKVGCKFTPSDGASCDDGDACSEKDTCQKSQCAGTKKTCSDGVACTQDACNYPNGDCSHVASDVACNDGNSCTTDTCDAKSDCQLKPVKLGASCGGAQVCSGKVCKLPWAVAVGVGDRFACALRQNKTINCWGLNDEAQLGSGVGGSGDANKPAAVFGGQSYVALSVGQAHVCAIDTTQNVWCWGQNNGKQCGNNKGDTTAKPIKVVGLTKATHIATGAHHSCAIAGASQQLYCWGESDVGETGIDAPSGNELLPHLVPLAGKGLLGVAVGTNHSCVVTAQKQVLCFGDNKGKQLGPEESGNYSADPVSITMGSKAITAVHKLSAGPTATWAIRKGAGKTLVWGTKPMGHSDPWDTVDPDLGDPVETPKVSIDDVAMGKHHTCLLMGSVVKCAGLSQQLALGKASTNSVQVPTVVSNLTAITAIAAGSLSSCALRADGAVLCWGQQVNGNMGTGKTGSGPTPPTKVLGSAP